MLGIYFVDPGEHIEHRTMIVHNHPECKSRVVYKGALDGKGAHSTWVGNALIAPTAPGTDSYELNRNLVLTPGAIADSEPNLEIETATSSEPDMPLPSGALTMRSCSICSPAAFRKPKPANLWCEAFLANSSRKSAFPQSANIS